MFDDMIVAIREDTAKLMLTAELVTASLNAKKTAAQAQSAGGDDSAQRRPERKKGKIGRNDPCPCGSGKKYKNCCGRDAG